MHHFKMVYELDDSVLINYNNNNLTAKICVKTGNTDFFKSYNSIPNKQIWENFDDEKIPFLFENEKAEIYTSENEITTINYDVFLGAFYFLSGWQERYSIKDDYGRFPYKKSIQLKLGIIDVPIVDYYFKILKQGIEKAYSIEIPFKTEFSVMLSHDVDKLFGWQQDVFSATKKVNLFGLTKLNLTKTKGKDHWDNLLKITDLEKELKVVSTFFMLCRKGIFDGVENADYDITNSKIQKNIIDIQKEGAEVALHGSYGTSDNLQNLKEDYDKLPHKANGNRFHFLNFDLMKTPTILDELGLQYDATLSFAEHPGFRNAYSHPFYLFNFETQEKYNFLEIPLNIMDTTFQQRKYVNCSPEKVMKKSQKIINQTKKFNGCLSILWHNNFFTDYKYKGWKEIYIDLVKDLKEKKAQFKTASQITNEVK